MLYDSYQNKIQKVVGFMRKVYAHRVVIASAVAGTVLVVAALLASRGIVIGGGSCPESVSYGTSIGYKAGAFLASVEYEYRADGESEGEWRAEEPREVGTYRVRAVSQGTFGDTRFGKEHTYTVTPREIVLTVADDKVPYGDDPAVSAELAYDDTLVCTGFDYGDLNKTKVKITADPAQAIVTDANGKDVTHCYALTSEAKQVTLIPRPISVTVSDKSAVYNGQELSFDGYEIDKDTPLVEGDHLQAEFTAAIVNAGTAKNTPTLHAYNADGRDVTDFYDFDIDVGKLTVTPRPVYVTTHDASFVYDGEAHDHPAHDDPASDGLVGDHRLVVIGTTEITDVGTAPNSLAFAVRDADGGDQTGNYSLMVETGKLTVTPRPLTVTTASDSRQYDGTPFSLPQWTSEGLVEGQELNGEKYEYYDSITNVGSIPNVLDLVVMAHDGNTIRNVTDNYDITYVYGTLTVTPREVTIQMDDGRWTYDGQPHTATGWSYADGSQEFVEDDLLVILDTTTVTTVADTRGGCHNEVYSYEITSIRQDLEGSPIVTGNYDLTILPGTFLISPRPVTLLPRQPDKIVYDDTWHSADDSITLYSWLNLVDGHSLTDVSFIGGGLDVGEYDVSIAEPVEILDEDGVPVTENYSLSYEKGTLTISPRPVTITTASHEWKYDGEAHSDTDYTVTGGMELVSGHRTNGIRPDGTVTTITDVQDEAPKNVLDAMIVDENGMDVTYRYDITYVYGRLLLRPRELTVRTNSNSWEYDGDGHYDKGFTVVGGDGLVSGHLEGSGIAYTVISEYVDGGIPNKMAIRVIDENGKAVSGLNYTVTKWQHGTLMITKRPITVRLSATKVYDGTPFSAFLPTDFHVLSAKGLPDDQSIVSAEVDMTITDVGTLSGIQIIDGSIVIKEGNRDTTENYSITTVAGAMTVTPRPIYVQSSSASKNYDGVPLTNPGCRVRSDSPYPLVSGHQLSANVTGQRTDVGFSPNTISKSSVRITDADGTDVTSNYDVQKCTAGTLTVEPAELTLTTGSAETTYYDGMPALTCGDYTIQVMGWDDDDYKRFDIAAAVTGSIGYIGKTLNEGDILWIYNLADGNRDALKNFNVIYDLGILTVHPPKKDPVPLAVFPYQVRKYYDGLPLSYNDDYCQILDPVDGMEVSIHFAINMTDVARLTLGELNANVEYYVGWYTVTQDGADVTDQYYLSFEGMPDDYVVAEIMPCAIELTSEGADLVYDDSVHSLSRPKVYISKGKLASGHYIYDPYIAEGILYEAGSTLNTINLERLMILDRWGRDVTANYDVSVVENELIWRSPEEEE